MPETATQTIAVLPFSNMGKDPDQEFFCDGITEEVINVLAKSPSLSVTARTSAFAFKGVNRDVREIGRSLGVDHVVEGSIRYAGGQVRITAQLIRASDGYHFWSEKWDRRLEDVFSVQDEVAGAISRKIQTSLNVEEAIVPSRKERPSRDPANYSLLIKARNALNLWTEEGGLKAIGFLEEALRNDPRFAEAYANLSGCYSMMGAIGYLPASEAFEKAQSYARIALDIDPGIPESHLSLAHVALWSKWDLETSLKHLEDVFKIQPDLPEALVLYATIQVGKGEVGLAAEAINRATIIDPLTPQNRYVRGILYFMEKKLDKALTIFENLYFTHPSFLPALEMKGVTMVLLGRLDEAMELFSAYPIDFDTTIRHLGGIGLVHAARGDREQALEQVAEMEKNPDDPKMAMYVQFLANIFRLLGEREQAVKYLQLGASMCVGDMLFLKSHQAWKEFLGPGGVEAVIESCPRPGELPPLGQE